ncbi:MAG: adenine phosphoribosyltransferase [Bacteroidota bacterium]
MTLEERIKSKIRDVPDFPKEGIVFKDITPLLKDVALSKQITSALAKPWEDANVQAIVGIESRGFIWGNALAQHMEIPFIPIRKKGKLPAETFSYAYDLEYGKAEIELHKDALEEEMRVLIHDDLLATGGTAKASAQLVSLAGAKPIGFSFLVALDFLEGHLELQEISSAIKSLISY